MASKGVTDRKRVAKAIVASARTHAKAVGERLQEVLAPAFPEGLVPFDLVEFQEGLARYLEMRTDAIRAADNVHLDEILDDDVPRSRRDEAAAGCYSALVGIRDAIRAAFGREHSKALLGYEGTTPTDPLVLAGVAEHALERLRELPIEPPPVRFGGVQIDLATLADELQPALDELKAALEAVALENRESEATLRDRDLALDAFDAAVAGIGRIVTGFDQLAGFPEFADRIRLTRPARRRAGTPNGDEPSPGDEEAPEVEVPSSPKSPASPADVESGEV
jgi:hypothetical protein